MTDLARIATEYLCKTNCPSQLGLTTTISSLGLKKYVHMDIPLIKIQTSEQIIV